MGLTVHAKGLPPEKSFDCGYVSYGVFIMELIRAAYGYECYEIYHNAFIARRAFTDKETEFWYTKCNKDLEPLIWHDDNEGSFSVKECRGIYKAIKDLKMDMMGHNYSDPTVHFNMLEQWKGIFKHCVDNRVRLHYS